MRLASRDEAASLAPLLHGGVEVFYVGRSYSMFERGRDDVPVIRHSVTAGSVGQGEVEGVLGLLLRRNSKGADWRRWTIGQVYPVLARHCLALGFKHFGIVFALRLASFQGNLFSSQGVADALYDRKKARARR